MSNLLGVSKTLERIDQFRDCVRAFAARAEQITRETRAQISRFERDFERTTTQEETDLSARIQEAEASFQASRSRAEARAERRRTGARQAHQKARRQRLKAIEDWESRRTFEIQRDILQSTRNRDAALQESDARLETFHALLTEQQQTLGALEARAQLALRGYPAFRRRLSAGQDSGNLATDENRLLEDLRAALGAAAGQIGRIRRSPLALFFAHLRLWLLVCLGIVAHVAVVPVLRYFEMSPVSYETVAGSLAAYLGAIAALYLVGRRRLKRAAGALADALDRARALESACAEQATARHHHEQAAAQGDHENSTTRLRQQWNEAIEEAARLREAWSQRLDQKAAYVTARIDSTLEAELSRLEQQRRATVEDLTQQTAAARETRAQEHREKLEAVAAAGDTRWQVLEAEWKTQIHGFYAEFEAAQAAAARLCPEWQHAEWKQWSPPSEFAAAVKFGHLEIDVEALCGTVPKDPRLALPGPARFCVPLMLTIPEEGSLLFETQGHRQDEIVGVLNNIVLRLLALAPPGRLNFTILDPVELGQSFAGLMHLADYEDRLINGRIWTQTAQIEQRLADLNEQIEKVTQMYLRNEYATIAQYNAQAGRITEKYHFLVAAGFPVNFSETAVKQLLSLAASGARCGVYTLILWDQRRSAPAGFVPEELRNRAVGIQAQETHCTLAGRSDPGIVLFLDAPPDADLATELLQRIGQCSIDSNRVEMPFAEVAPPEPQTWSQQTNLELRVPIGMAGATKLQYLALGKGTRQHALIAGKTGSGKSTLFHVIVTNLALWYSPDEIEFYLVDFKKGVEFKCYATHHLPHARAIAIESDREFGLSVLERVDAELRRRGDLFRQLGVQDLAGYREAGGAECVPRTLLIVDEFQEFFVEDDRVSQNAALLLDRFVRQGRAFGIHVLLGSQTLGGAYTLARATLGQMVVRVALQCNEADAYLIMDDTNGAPRLLSRPGEAIYNDTSGTLEGNSPFQVVWLPDALRESLLEKVRTRADQAPRQYPRPIVFEGNAPADVRDNPLLEAALAAETLAPTPHPCAWLGAPNSIKGPTEAVFRRQSGNNLLVVGHREEASLAILAISLVSLAVQHPRGSARFVIIDSTPPDTSSREFLEAMVGAIPHQTALASGGDLTEVMARLIQELEERASSQARASGPALFLFVNGVQRFKALRNQDEFGFSLEESAAGAQPGAQFHRLITDGPAVGVHVVCTCDTASNVTRCLGRKALAEFEMRVLFQMSPNDSASLIDSTKASELGLYRAVFSHVAEGHLETFRPYALPDRAWIERVARDLQRLLGTVTEERRVRGGQQA